MEESFEEWKKNGVEPRLELESQAAGALLSRRGSYDSIFKFIFMAVLISPRRLSPTAELKLCAGPSIKINEWDGPAHSSTHGRKI
jgi:hypothetical protein